MTELLDLFYIVINTEEQYSIWPAYKPIPMGWKSLCSAQTKQECLDYIQQVWVDMRPLSLRNAMKNKVE